MEQRDAIADDKFSMTNCQSTLWNSLAFRNGFGRKGTGKTGSYFCADAKDFFEPRKAQSAQAAQAEEETQGVCDQKVT
jgi:hypothetical protein